MITVNISGLDEIRNKIASIDMDRLCYKVASTLKAEIKHRVHVEGKASDGSKIGKYSKGYMRVRTGQFDNSEYYKKGKKQGELKKTGVFIKGKNKGSDRPKYNRDIKRDVVLSLTRQMENDIDATQPIPIEGGYGIGYSNDHNYDKAKWNAERYGKLIWNLSEEEKQVVREIVSKYVDEINH